MGISVCCPELSQQESLWDLCCSVCLGCVSGTLWCELPICLHIPGRKNCVKRNLGEDSRVCREAQSRQAEGASLFKAAAFLLRSEDS